MFRLIRPFLLTSVLLTASSLFAQDAMPTTPYYPLKIGNTWTYKTKEGNKFVMKVAQGGKGRRNPLRPRRPLRRWQGGRPRVHLGTGDGVFRNGFGSATPDSRCES